MAPAVGFAEANLSPSPSILFRVLTSTRPAFPPRRAFPRLHGGITHRAAVSAPTIPRTPREGDGKEPWEIFAGSWVPARKINRPWPGSKRGSVGHAGPRLPWRRTPRAVRRTGCGRNAARGETEPRKAYAIPSCAIHEQVLFESVRAPWPCHATPYTAGCALSPTSHPRFSGLEHDSTCGLGARGIRTRKQHAKQEGPGHRPASAERQHPAPCALPDLVVAQMLRAVLGHGGAQPWAVVGAACMAGHHQTHNTSSEQPASHLRATT